MPPYNPVPVAAWRDCGEPDAVLAVFRVDALGNDCGRLQNGAATTGKLIHFSVRCGKASNGSVLDCGYYSFAYSAFELGGRTIFLRG